eukprot:COSAG04_NODE_5292_length_1670_cov_3.492043_2_plen_221_part_00
MRIDSIPTVGQPRSRLRLRLQAQAQAPGSGSGSGSGSSPGPGPGPGPPPAPAAPGPRVRLRLQAQAQVPGSGSRLRLRLQAQAQAPGSGSGSGSGSSPGPAPPPAPALTSTAGWTLPLPGLDRGLLPTPPQQRQQPLSPRGQHSRRAAGDVLDGVEKCRWAPRADMRRLSPRYCPAERQRPRSRPARARRSGCCAAPGGVGAALAVAFRRIDLLRRGGRV